MSHLKKDFKYHKLFDNKYSEQSYIAYLSKGKRKYVMNSSDFVDRYIVITIDFILNNFGNENKTIEEKASIKDSPLFRAMLLTLVC